MTSTAPSPARDAHSDDFREVLIVLIEAFNVTREPVGEAVPAVIIGGHRITVINKVAGQCSISSGMLTEPVRNQDFSACARSFLTSNVEA